MPDTVTLALVGGTGLTELQESDELLILDTPYGAPSAPIRGWSPSCSSCGSRW